MLFVIALRKLLHKMFLIVKLKSSVQTFWEFDDRYGISMSHKTMEIIMFNIFDFFIILGQDFLFFKFIFMWCMILSSLCLMNSLSTGLRLKIFMNVLLVSSATSFIYISFTIEQTLNPSSSVSLYTYIEIFYFEMIGISFAVALRMIPSLNEMCFNA